MNKQSYSKKKQNKQTLVLFIKCWKKQRICIIRTVFVWCEDLIDIVLPA